MGTVLATDDLDAQLAAAYQADQEVADMARPDVRRARERKHALDPNDGRRKRATGRNVQFNIKVKADLKRRMVQASRQEAKSIAIIAEELFEAYLKTLAKKRGTA